jgi:CII-binding regulator of phage lambda lysogenization HflD
MAMPLGVEARIKRLEAPLEQLPARMDGLAERMESLDVRVDQLASELRTGHVMIVTALTEQIEQHGRQMRVLHEDVLSRFLLFGERLAAQDEKSDATQAENRAMFERLLARAESPASRPKRKRR